MMVNAPLKLTPNEAVIVNVLAAPELMLPVKLRVVAPDAPALLYANGPVMVAAASVTAGALAVTDTVPARDAPFENDSAGPLLDSVEPDTSVRLLLALRVRPVPPVTDRVPVPAGNVRDNRVTVTAALMVRVAEPVLGANRLTARPLVVPTLTDEPDCSVT